MKSPTMKWSIYLLTLCSFPQCSHVTKLFSNVIEENMKAMDEIISKSKSYNMLVDTFRQNWESPVSYLVERGYIPIEEAKPDKLSRDTIEKMQKQYEENDNDITNGKDESAMSKNFDEMDTQIRNRKGFRQRKACSTTTEEPPIVNTESSTCKTVTTTEHIEITTSEKPTCEPITVNPLYDLEETTTCAPVETTTIITDNGESSSTMKDCTPASNVDECEYEDNATDCYDDGHANQKTQITTTPQLPSKVPDGNTTSCDSGEETTTAPKPTDDKQDSATECFLGKSYGIQTAFPFRFQFDYPPADYPLNEKRKIESAITALRGRPGAFELAKEIAESTVAEYTHNLSQLANMSKSVRGENDKRKRSERERSTKTKFQNPTWYSHPKQWNPQEKPWQSKQTFYHYSPPLLQAWHPDHPHPTQVSRQKITGKIVQKPFLHGFRKEPQAVKSHGLKNFKSRLKAEPVVSTKLWNLSKPMSKSTLKGYEPKKQFSNFNKKDKSLTGKGSSFFASKSHSAQNDFDYFDTKNEDYIYDDPDAYIALNAVYLENKMDIDNNQRVAHSNSVNPEEAANQTQVNQKLDSIPPAASSDSKDWDAMKSNDESNKQSSKTVSNSFSNVNNDGKDDKAVTDGSIGGDSSNATSNDSPQNNKKNLSPKASYEKSISQNSKSTSLPDNINLSNGYANPSDLSNKESQLSSQISYSNEDSFHQNVVDKTANTYGYEANHDDWQHFKPGETETEFFRALEAKYLNEYQKPDNVTNPILYNTEPHLDWEQPDTNEKTNDKNDLSTGTRNKETQNNWKSGNDFSTSLDYGNQNSGSVSSKSMDYKSSNGFNNPNTDAGTDISKPAKVEVYIDWQHSKDNNQQTKDNSDQNNQKPTNYNTQQGKQSNKFDDGFSMSVEDISSNYWQNQKGNKPASNDNSQKFSDTSQISNVKTGDSSNVLFEKGSDWKYSKPSAEGAIGFVKPESVAIEKYGGGIGNIYLKLATTANMMKSSDSNFGKTKPQHDTYDIKPTESLSKNKVKDVYLNNYLVPTFDANLKPKNKFLKNANLVAKKAKEASQSYNNYESHNGASSWKEPRTITNANENSISKRNYNPLGELSFFNFEKKPNTNPGKRSETYYENSMYSQKQPDQIKYPSESILNLYRYKNMNKNLEDIFKNGQDQKTVPIKSYSYNDDKSTFIRSLRYIEPRVDLTQECKDIVKQAVHNITTSKFPEMALMNLRKRSANELNED